MFGDNEHKTTERIFTNKFEFIHFCQIYQPQLLSGSFPVSQRSLYLIHWSTPISLPILIELFYKAYGVLLLWRIQIRLLILF
jgi:hypothetical protein